MVKDYNFGLVNLEEGKAIYEILELLSERFPFLNVLEIGVYQGGTARAICRILGDLRQPFQYYGIDKKMEIDLSKFSNEIFIEKDANDHTILDILPKIFHFLFIDGCHCKECVMKEAEIYLDRLVPKGIVVFHDTSEKSQGDPIPGGCEGKTIGVLSALKELRLEEKGFAFIREEIPIEKHGIRFYQKNG